MKKLLFAFVLVFLSLGHTGKAVIFVPTTNLTIVVQTGAHDEGLFHFDLKQLAGTRYALIDSFDLQTVDSIASKTISINAYPDGNFMLSELAPADKRVSVSCVSDKLGDIFYPQINGIVILPVPDGNITCVFNNVYLKTPVLIVPGVLGSELAKDSDLLWADLSRMVNPFNNDDFMDPLKFDDNMKPTDNSLHLIGILRKKVKHLVNKDLTLYNYSQALIDDLVAQGYVEGEDLFTFPYDWRYGVGGGDELNIKSLKGQIDYILNQTSAGQAVGKVDIVAHSTGALIVKKYVQEHPADHHIDKAIFAGAPILGAPKAYKAVLAGDSFGIPGLSDSEMKKLSQNMPVVYDLAPSFEYYSQAGSFFQINDIDNGTTRDLDYNQAMVEIRGLGLVNSQAITNAENLHTPEFDNLDLRTSGVNVYNLIGCKVATYSKITEFTQQLQPPIFDSPKYTTGDGTVPLTSAQNNPVDADHTYFAVKTNHGNLLSGNGPRQQIVNIISGSSLATPGILSHSAVAANPKLCKIKGETIKIKSPVDISVTDADGNHSGLTEDGSIENLIPGADYEIWGEHKYLFLPTDDGQTYNINLQGTGEGTFTLEDESIDGDVTTNLETFANIPVTSNLQGQVILMDGKPSLVLDNDGDGITDETLAVDVPEVIAEPLASSSGGGGGPAPGAALQVIAPVISGKVLSAATFKNGSLVLDTTDGRTVYIINNGKKYGFVSEKVFLGLGYKFKNLIIADVSGVDSDDVINNANRAHPNGTLVRNGQTIWMIVSSTRSWIPNMDSFSSEGYDIKNIVPANKHDLQLPVRI